MSSWVVGVMKKIWKVSESKKVPSFVDSTCHKINGGVQNGISVQILDTSHTYFVERNAKM